MSSPDFFLCRFMQLAAPASWSLVQLPCQAMSPGGADREAVNISLYNQSLICRIDVKYCHFQHPGCAFFQVVFVSRHVACNCRTARLKRNEPRNETNMPGGQHEAAALTALESAGFRASARLDQASSKGWAA
jgi:hypothetical protein